MPRNALRQVRPHAPRQAHRVGGVAPVAPDGWITKAQAAQRLGVETRTIERRASAGRIGAKARPGFPTLYRASDVEKLKREGTGEVQTGILEPVGPSVGSGSSPSTAMTARTAALHADMVEVFRMLRADLPLGPTGPTDAPTGPTGPTLSDAERDAQWVTLKDAARIKGRTVTYLRRAIKDGRLRAEKDGGWRIPRKALQAL